MSKRKEYNYKYIKKKHNNYRSTCTDNRCEICGKTEKDNGKRLAVDHNHETGMIRGMLCNNCNLGIGYLKDNIDLLKSAIKYLKKKKGHVPFDT